MATCSRWAFRGSLQSPLSASPDKNESSKAAKERDALSARRSDFFRLGRKLDHLPPRRIRQVDEPYLVQVAVVGPGADREFLRRVRVVEADVGVEPDLLFTALAVSLEGLVSARSKARGSRLCSASLETGC